MTAGANPTGPPRPPPPQRKLLARYDGDGDPQPRPIDKPSAETRPATPTQLAGVTRINVKMPEAMLRKVEKRLGDVHRRGLVIDALDRFGEQLADRSLDFMGATDGGPTRTWTIRLSAHTRKDVERIARLRGWTMSGTVRTLVAHELDRRW